MSSALWPGRTPLSHFGDHLGVLMQVLSLLARNVKATGNKPPKSHSAVVAALKLIDDDPTEPWTLTRVAAQVHIDHTYLIRLFHSVVGLSPMAYLNRRRLELATSFLRRGDLPVGEVGAMAGWLDANYFTRCFREHFGMSPSRYRTRFLELQGPPGSPDVVSARTAGIDPARSA